MMNDRMTFACLKNVIATRWPIMMALGLFSCLALSTASAFAQNNASQATIEVTVSKDSVYIADPVDIIITVLANESSSVTLGPIPKTLGDFEVVDYAEQLDLPDEQPGRRLWKRRLTLECLLSGEQNLPPFQVLVRTAGQTETLQSQSISIQVISSLADDSDPRQPADIAGTVNVDLPDTDSFAAWFQPTIFVLAGLGVFVLLAWGLLKQRNRLPSPLRQAKRDLAELAAHSNFDGSQGTPKIGKAERIIREFVERQTGIPATKLTATELTDQLAQRYLVSQDAAEVASNRTSVNSTVKPTPLVRLQQWLSESERIRFANSMTEQETSIASLDEVDSMIDQLAEWFRQPTPYVKQGS